MTLEIFLLGQFKLIANNQIIELPSRPAQSLLAYLALNAGVTIRREKLASLLWCDAEESNSRGYLRQALWRIRKSLEGASLSCVDYLQIDEIAVTFNRQSDYWLDVDQIMKPIEGQPIDGTIADVDLFRGELLPGFYDEWIELERDRVQAAYNQKMDALLERMIQSQRWDEVLKRAEQWIRQGYSTEPAYRALMKAHAAMGNRGMICLTYNRCKEALMHDLGVEPSPETTGLFEQLQFSQAPVKATTVPSKMEFTKKPSFLIDDRQPPHMESVKVFAREQEIARLDHIFKKALNGQGRAVFVTGEAGSGKTTVVSEFARRAREAHKDLIIASGNCNAHTGIGDPYLPFREIMDLLTGDVEARWSAGAITKEYAQFLWDLIPVSVQALMDAGSDLIDSFVSWSALHERAAAYAAGESNFLFRLEAFLKQRSTEPVSRNQLQSDLFIQYVKVLHIIARQFPIVLILDDLQWADLGSISLLFHLGRHLAGNRIMVIGVFRPEEIALGRSDERHPLEPVVNELQRIFGDVEINVDQIEGRAYIDELLDSEPNGLGMQFREMLFQLTSGHPLFTIELLRGMQERGDIIKNKSNCWVEGPNLSWEKLPARVEAVIAERIGRLDAALQATLRVACVEGEIFTAEVGAKIRGCQESEILNQLSNELERKHRLVRAHSIQRIEGSYYSSYRFCHYLVQKYLYSSLDEIEKVHLHEQVGNTLEGLYSHQLESGVISPKLAYHFIISRNIEKAVYYLQQSAAHAMLVSAHQEAVVHLKQALDLIVSSPDPRKYDQLELSLCLDLSTSLHHARGSVDLEAEDTARRALELSEKIGTTLQLCQILGRLSIFNYVKGNNQSALAYAQRLFELATQSQNEVLMGLAHWCLGIIYYCFGEYQKSRFYLEKTVASYDPQKHHQFYALLCGVDVGLSAMAYLASCLWCLGFPDQARLTGEKAMQMAGEIDHAFTLQDVIRYGCCEVEIMSRDAEALITDAKGLILLADGKGFSGWLANGKYCLGEGFILEGRFKEGIELIEAGIRREFSFRTKVSTPGAFCYLAEGYLRLGNNKKAMDIIEESMNVILQTDQHHWEPENFRILAAIQLEQGDEVGAEKSLKKAIDLAREMDGKSWELRATLDLAHLWKRQGKKEESRQLVKEIYSWFTEGFDTPEMQEASRLYEEIS